MPESGPDSILPELHSYGELHTGAILAGTDGAGARTARFVPDRRRRIPTDPVEIVPCSGLREHLKSKICNSRMEYTLFILPAYTDEVIFSLFSSPFPVYRRGRRFSSASQSALTRVIALG
jgi:hypothetical protein